MKSYKLSELSPFEVESLKARPRIDFSSIFTIVSLCFVSNLENVVLGFFVLMIENADIFFFFFLLCQVNPIVDDVRKRGDAAVKE